MDPRDYPVIYPDSNGVVFTTPGGAIESNQAGEKDAGRGSSGACTQDSNNVPNNK